MLSISHSPLLHENTAENRKSEIVKHDGLLHEA